VYLDKDLVLPPMAGAGPEQTYFVVASTDAERVEIMLARIRGQLAKLDELNACGKFTVSASPVLLPSETAEYSLEQQVGEVAECVTGMARAALDPMRGLSHKK
jgi:hypothetical protein